VIKIDSLIALVAIKEYGSIGFTVSGEVVMSKILLIVALTISLGTGFHAIGAEIKPPAPSGTPGGVFDPTESFRLQLTQQKLLEEKVKLSETVVPWSFLKDRLESAIKRLQKLEPASTQIKEQKIELQKKALAADVGELAKLRGQQAELNTTLAAPDPKINKVAIQEQLTDLKTAINLKNREVLDLARKIGGDLRTISQNFTSFRNSIRAEIREEYGADYNIGTDSEFRRYLKEFEKEIVKVKLPSLQDVSRFCNVGYLRFQLNSRNKYGLIGNFDKCEKALNETDQFHSAYQSTATEFLKTKENEVSQKIHTFKNSLKKGEEESQRISKRLQQILSLKKDQQEKEAQEKGIVIDQNAMIVIGMTLTAWIVIILFIIIAIVRIANIENSGGKDARPEDRLIIQKLKQYFKYPIFLDIITVFLLTATILVLGIANKLSTETLAALIAGISGYVLGRMKDEARNSNSSPPPRQIDSGQAEAAGQI